MDEIIYKSDLYRAISISIVVAFVSGCIMSIGAYNFHNLLFFILCLAISFVMFFSSFYMSLRDLFVEGEIEKEVSEMAQPKYGDPMYEVGPTGIEININILDSVRFREEISKLFESGSAMFYKASSGKEVKIKFTNKDDRFVKIL